MDGPRKHHSPPIAGTRTPVTWTPPSIAELQTRARKARWEKTRPQLEALAGCLVAVALIVAWAIFDRRADGGLVETQGDVTIYRADPTASRGSWIPAAVDMAVAVALIIIIRRRAFCGPLAIATLLLLWISAGRTAERNVVVRVTSNAFSVGEAQQDRTFYFKDIETLTHYPRGLKKGSREHWVCTLKSSERVDLDLGVEPSRTWSHITANARAAGVETQSGRGF